MKINLKYVITIILMLFLAVSGVFSSVSCVKCKKSDFMEGLSNITITTPVYLRLEPGQKNDVKKIRACSASKFARYNPQALNQGDIKRPDTVIIAYVRDDQFPSQITINASNSSAQVDVMELDVEHLSINAHPSAKVFYRPSRFVKISTLPDSVVYDIAPYLRTKYAPKRIPPKQWS